MTRSQVRILPDTHLKMKTRTYFFVKPGTGVSREQIIKEAKAMSNALKELKLSGKDKLIKDGKIIIEKLDSYELTHI